MLLLWNKVDTSPLPESLYIDDVKALLPISAKQNLGIDNLGTYIAKVLEEKFGGKSANDNSDNACITNAGIATERQKELINRAESALTEALELADTMRPLDIIAPCLREAVNALGEITGEVSTADILDAMFSRFCIGK
jgi:tRNA modification GTPase